MKIIVSPTNYNEAISLINNGVDILLLGDAKHSTRMTYNCQLDDLKTICNNKKKTEIWVNVNAFFYEQDIDDLEKYLKEIQTLKIDKVVFNDFEKKEIVWQLQDETRKEILLPVNVFTSYAHDGILAAYPGEMVERKINIKEYIDVKDILLWDSYVSYYSNNNRCDRLCYMGDCEAEVFVINRSINGWRYVDRNCFIYESLPTIRSCISSKPILEHDIYMPNSSVFEEKCIYIRPCEEEDCITKWVMKRNMKKYNILRDGD